ncbi:hypothetical protein [Luteolibacter sp. AS25]|uniref:hypothetical protein n=1 Tax=Luteolibacter sp. AS25 TaxID=3135776 RepID=UPI00398AB727
MKLIKAIATFLCLVGTALAAKPIQYRVEFTYDGMDPKWLSDLSDESRSRVTIENGLMPFFHAVVIPDKTATIQLLGEVPNVSGENVLCGIVVKFTTVAFEDGVKIAGESQFKRRIPKPLDSSAAFAAFESEEAAFNGKVPFDRPTVICSTGEGENRTLLTAKVVALDATGKPIKKP